MRIRWQLLAIVGFSILPALFLTLFSDWEKMKDARESLESESVQIVHHAESLYNAEAQNTRQFLSSLITLNEIQTKNVAACNQIFAKLRTINPQYASVGLANKDGLIIACDPPVKPQTVSIADRKYFKDLVYTKKFAVGEFAYGKVSGKPALHFALPVLTDKGDIDSILFLSYDLSTSNNKFDGIRFPPKAQYGILDPQGVLILHSNPKQECGGKAPDFHLKKMLGDRREGSYVANCEKTNEPSLFTFHQLRLTSDMLPSICIYMRVPLSIVETPIQRMLLRDIGLLLLAWLIAGFIAWKIGDVQIVRKLELLIEASNRIALGNFSRRVGISHKDGELGQLASSFDKMVDSLQERNRDLRISEERYRQLIDNAHEGIAVCQDQRFKFINPAFTRITGLAEEDLPDKDIFDILHPDDREKVIERHKRRLRGEKVPTSSEFRIFAKDGSTVWLHVSSVRIEWSGKSASLDFFVDITASKKSEAERALLEERLRQNERIDSIGRLAGSIAHDFNNLLTPILGYAEMSLQILPKSDPSHPRFQGILECAEQAKALTRQILAFSRKQSLQLKIIDINTEIQHIERMIQRLIGKNIQIVTQLSELPLPKVRADAAQMHQVIMNLAVNANDAMSSGGKLTIKTSSVTINESYSQTHPDVKPGDYILIEVSDTGCGMPPETLSHIFEPFFTTKEPGKGTGLGLATVYGIVKQHGGHVFAYSEVGRGTTFKIYLPTVIQEVSPEKHEPMSARTANHKGTQTILIVEDEEMIRTLIAGVLRQLGYTVLDSGDSLEALRLLQSGKQKVDLLVSDIVMPQMNGIELYKRVRESLPKMKALFMSGYSSSSFPEQEEILDAAHFIQKPFNVSDLTKKVYEILNS